MSRTVRQLSEAVAASESKSSSSTLIKLETSLEYIVQKILQWDIMSVSLSSEQCTLPTVEHKSGESILTGILCSAAGQAALVEFAVATDGLGLLTAAEYEAQLATDCGQLSSSTVGIIAATVQGLQMLLHC